MFWELFQSSKLFVANIANKCSWEVIKRTANVAAYDALVPTMQKNIFQRNYSNFAGVAAETRWSMLRSVEQCRFGIRENWIAVFALVNLTKRDHPNKSAHLKFAGFLWITFGFVDNRRFVLDAVACAQRQTFFFVDKNMVAHQMIPSINFKDENFTAERAECKVLDDFRIFNSWLSKKFTEVHFPMSIQAVFVDKLTATQWTFDRATHIRTVLRHFSDVCDIFLHEINCPSLQSL